MIVTIDIVGLLLQNYSQTDRQDKLTSNFAIK